MRPANRRRRRRRRLHYVRFVKYLTSNGQMRDSRLWSGEFLLDQNRGMHCSCYCISESNPTSTPSVVAYLSFLNPVRPLQMLHTCSRMSANTLCYCCEIFIHEFTHSSADCSRSADYVSLASTALFLFIVYSTSISGTEMMLELGQHLIGTPSHSSTTREYSSLLDPM